MLSARDLPRHATPVVELSGFEVSNGKLSKVDAFGCSVGGSITAARALVDDVQAPYVAYISFCR